MFLKFVSPHDVNLSPNPGIFFDEYLIVFILFFHTLKTLFV